MQPDKHGRGKTFRQTINGNVIRLERNKQMNVDYLVFGHSVIEEGGRAGVAVSKIPSGTRPNSICRDRTVASRRPRPPRSPKSLLHIQQSRLHYKLACYYGHTFIVVERNVIFHINGLNASHNKIAVSNLLCNRLANIDLGQVMSRRGNITTPYLMSHANQPRNHDDQFRFNTSRTLSDFFLLNTSHKYILIYS